MEAAPSTLLPSCQLTFRGHQSFPVVGNLGTDICLRRARSLLSRLSSTSLLLFYFLIPFIFSLQSSASASQFTTRLVVGFSELWQTRRRQRFVENERTRARCSDGKSEVRRRGVGVPREGRPGLGGRLGEDKFEGIPCGGGGSKLPPPVQTPPVYNDSRRTLSIINLEMLSQESPTFGVSSVAQARGRRLSRSR